MADDADVALFTSIGMLEKKAKETLRNSDLTKTLKEVIEAAGASNGCSKEVGNTLYTLATKKDVPSKHRAAVAKYIGEGKITANLLSHAITYVKGLGDAELNVEEFEKASGVGVVVSESEILEEVNKLLEEKSSELEEKRYKVNLGGYLNILRGRLKFADMKLVVKTFNSRVAEVLGPRTSEDKKKTKSEKPAAKQENEATLPASALIDS